MTPGHLSSRVGPALVQLARGWGYDRIVGPLANLGYTIIGDTISDQTVGDTPKRRWPAFPQDDQGWIKPFRMA